MAKTTARDVIEEKATADRLLEVTERLVLDEGAASLSIRRIGLAAQVSSGLVSYHFGGLNSLLERLLVQNVQIMDHRRRELLDSALKEPNNTRRLDLLICAYVEPVWRTASAWHPRPACTVVRELLPAVDTDARQRTVAIITRSVDSVARPLMPLLPHLSYREVFMRLRLLSGASEMLQPRLDELGLFSVGRDLARLRDEQLSAEMMRFSKGALLAK